MAKPLKPIRPLAGIDLATVTPAEAIRLITEIAETTMPNMSPTYYEERLREIAALARIIASQQKGPGS